MHEEGEKVFKLSANEIRGLGFAWPKYALIEEYCVPEAGEVDLARTIERMQSSQAYYKRQLDEAFAFKTRHGADYSDFTDRFDDYARMHRELSTAIAYVEEIIEAVKGLGP
jgi:hypothetical protein